MHRLLRLGTGHGTELVCLPASLTRLSSREATKVCGLVCAYRLLDIIAMLGDFTPNALHLERRLLRVGKMIYVRIPYIFLLLSENLPQGMDKLGDWPAVVKNFRTIMQRLKTDATAELPDARSPTPVRLLHLIARNKCSQHYSKVEGNFLSVLFLESGAGPEE